MRIIQIVSNIVESKYTDIKASSKIEQEKIVTNFILQKNLLGNILWH